MGEDITFDDFHLVGKILPPIPLAPNWMEYPVVKQQIRGDTLYADIMNHYSGRLSYPDRMTEAHETTHMINADIRNKNGNGIDPVAFYVGGNRACTFVQPKMMKHNIAPFVPNGLRGDRYATYVTGQTEWDDSPLYLYDEWNAYTNGGRVCVEQVKAGTYKDGWTDGVMGLLEFSVYAVATVMAIDKFDSGYYNRVPEFMKYTRWALEEAYQTYSEGSVMTEFKWDKQDQYFATLTNGSTAGDIRAVLSQRFGKVWVK
jgi:hypothetical protein